ncbi:MAG: hypothetical protein GXX94_09435 [Chloroflexi bacterium]|nr:hypothetical protein [Chloroflexota bacterium]
MSHEEIRELLAEFAVEGHLDQVHEEILKRHLACCAKCRLELAHLRRVEYALRTWPLERVDAPLHARLMAMLATAYRESPPAMPSWPIWVPLVTIALAMGLALLLAPAMPALSLPDPTTEFAQATASAHGRDALLAIWIGAAVALAGAGLTTALSQAVQPGHPDLQSVRRRAAEAAEHIRQFATHGR